MTPTSITTLPIGAAPSVTTPPGGDPDAFGALLSGLQAANPIAAAGTALPDARQAIAGEADDLPLPALETVLQTGEGAPVPPGPGCALDPDGPALPELGRDTLPAGLARIAGEIAAPGKSRASLHSRALPTPFRALMADAGTPTDASGETSAESSPKSSAKARERSIEPGFAAEAPRLDPAPEREPVTVSARVAETPAVEHATAALDPARLAKPAREAAPLPPSPGEPQSAPAELAESAVNAQPAQVAEAEAQPESAPAATPVEARGPAPQAADIARQLATAARDTSVPPPFAGLTPAGPQGRKTASDTEAPRDRTPSGQPFQALAALAAGQEPLRPLPAALTAHTPAEPAAFADLVPGIDGAAGTSGQTASFGFHPATLVHVRGADLGQTPVIDTSRADWLQSMIERIGEIRHEGGARQTQIRLAPDALGTVDIRIEQRDDRIHVAMSAENPQARAMLAEAAPRLQDMAEARGLRLSQSSVDAGQSQQQQRRAPQEPATPSAPAAARRDTQTSTARSQDRIA